MKNKIKKALNNLVRQYKKTKYTPSFFYMYRVNYTKNHIPKRKGIIPLLFCNTQKPKVRPMLKPLLNNYKIEILQNDK